MRIKSFLILFISFLFILPAASMSKPSLNLDEVLAKYYTAIGGVEKWRALNTMVMKGSLTSQDQTMPITAYHERPGKCRVEFKLDDTVMAQVYGGFFAWQINPLSGSPDPTPMTQGRTNYLRDTCGIESSLLDYKKKGYRVKLLGEEKINGKNSYKVSVKYRSGNLETYYLDAETFLPVRTLGLYEMDGNEIRTTTTFSNYKDTEGYVVPYLLEVEIHGAPSTEVLKISKIEFNPKIDSAMFDFPREKMLKMQSKEDIEKAIEEKKKQKK